MGRVWLITSHVLSLGVSDFLAHIQTIKSQGEEKLSWYVLHCLYKLLHKPEKVQSARPCFANFPGPGSPPTQTLH